MSAPPAMAEDVFLYLLTKPLPTLRTASMCRSAKKVDANTASLPPYACYGQRTPQDRSVMAPAAHCTRPMWGSDPHAHDGLCSRCWHEREAIGGTYSTMKANPASHDLSREGIRRLTFARDGDPLPPTPLELLDAAQQPTSPIDSMELWLHFIDVDHIDPEPEQYGEQDIGESA